MSNSELQESLKGAKNLDEVKAILQGHPELNPERVWQEIDSHRSNVSEKLDLNELDAVSGGADRDWQKDGCAATCEQSSWCGSNDFCQIWDVTYDNFWRTCPDGHEHVFNNGDVCVRCGYVPPFNPDTGPRG